MPYLKSPFAQLMILWLVLCSYLAAVHAKPAKDAPPVPLSPVGVWSGARGDALYLVTITADGMYWRTTWEDDTGRVLWTGTMKRDAGGLLERYGPPGSACDDWTWQELGAGFLGKDGWTLKVVPDF